MVLDSRNIVNVEKITAFERNVCPKGAIRRAARQQNPKIKEISNCGFSRRGRHMPLRSKSLCRRQRMLLIIIWELSHTIYLTRYTKKKLYPEYRMDTSKYHGSSETEIALLTTLIRTRIDNQVHVDFSQFPYTLYLSRTLFTYLCSAWTGCSPFEQKEKAFCHYINRFIFT